MPLITENLVKINLNWSRIIRQIIKVNVMIKLLKNYTLLNGDLILVSLILLVSCSSQSTLSPFSSDGCSLFPNASLITKTDWTSCCLAHDIVYWAGGTASERKLADSELQECVLQKTGNKPLSYLMYNGVRIGGSPYFYNWYRWGYGWSYDRKYQELAPDERKFAENILKDTL